MHFNILWRGRRTIALGLAGFAVIAGAASAAWLAVSGVGGSEVHSIGSPDPTGQRDPDYIKRETGVYKDSVIRRRTASSVDFGDGVRTAFAEVVTETDGKGLPIRVVERVYGPDGSLRQATLRLANGEAMILGPKPSATPGADALTCGASKAVGRPLDARHLPSVVDRRLIAPAGWDPAPERELAIEKASPVELAGRFPRGPMGTGTAVFSWAGSIQSAERWTSQLTDPSSGTRRVRVMTVDPQSGRPVGWQSTTVDAAGAVLEAIETLELAIDVFPKTAAILAVFDLESSEVTCVS